MPTLIWNSEMRSILKMNILENSERLMAELLRFVKLNKEYVNIYQDIPKYEGPLKDVVYYRFIEEEYKCGQYYLRVWT